MTHESKEQVAVRFSTPMKQRVERIATQLGLSFSDVVRLAVRAQLADLEPSNPHPTSQPPEENPHA